MARDIETINAINAATMKNIALNGGNSREDEYYGYVKVKIFDCPPFLMFTNNDCPRCSEVMFLRKFEPGSMKLWCTLARSATAIIDIGAQVGVYALAAAALRSDIFIHAFEPNPYAFTRLRINRRVNKFTNIAEHAVAVGHKSDSVVELVWRVRAEESIASGARIGRVATEGTDSAIARLVRLDDAVLENLGPRGLIKIDVEGAESNVFEGMPRILQSRPDIILETFNAPAAAEIAAIVHPMGYSAYTVDEESGTLIPEEKLTAANRKLANLNQFLTCRPLDPALAGMVRT